MLAEIITESNIPDKELEIYLTNKRQEYLVNLEKKPAIWPNKEFSALDLQGKSSLIPTGSRKVIYQRITVSLIRDFYHRYYQAGTIPDFYLLVV